MLLLAHATYTHALGLRMSNLTALRNSKLTPLYWYTIAGPGVQPMTIAVRGISIRVDFFLFCPESWTSRLMQSNVRAVHENRLCLPTQRQRTKIEGLCYQQCLPLTRQSWPHPLYSIEKNSYHVMASPLRTPTRPRTPQVWESSLLRLKIIYWPWEWNNSKRTGSWFRRIYFL